MTQGIISATVAMYVECATAASRDFTRNWIVVPAALVLAYVSITLQGFTAGMGMAGGFIAGLIQLLAMTLYFTWAAAAANRDKLKLHDLTSVDWNLFFAIINVSFVIWLAEYFFQLAAMSSGSAWVLAMFRLGVVLVCNSLAEHIYIHRQDGLHALSQSAAFTKDNAPEWYLPFALLLAPFFLIAPNYIPFLLSNTPPLLPWFVVIQTPLLLMPGALIPALVAGVALAHWFTLFRAHLFTALESGSRRQRIFRAKQR